MLLGSFIIDENSLGWTNDKDLNIMRLRNEEFYMNEIIRHKGYIYLNEICERIGAKWNPKDDNPCVIADDVTRIAFIELEVFNKPNNTYLVIVHRYE